MMLDEVATYLAAQGVGTVGTDLFKSRMPDTPDAAGVLIETGGQAPEFPLGSTAVRFEKPTLQVIFRGAPNDYSGPRTKATSTRDQLVAIKAPTVLSGTTYYLVIPLQEPFAYQVDDKQRHWISCNYSIQKDPS